MPTKIERDYSGQMQRISNNKRSAIVPTTAGGIKIKVAGKTFCHWLNLECPLCSHKKYDDKRTQGCRKNYPRGVEIIVRECDGAPEGNRHEQ